MDRIELLVEDGAQATRDYEILLGRKASWIEDVASIRLGNVTLLLRQVPDRPGLDFRFEVDGPVRMARRLDRLGLSTLERVGRLGGSTNRADRLDGNPLSAARIFPGTGGATVRSLTSTARTTSPSVAFAH